MVCYNQLLLLTISFRALHFNILIGCLTMQGYTLRLIIFGLLDKAQAAVALVTYFAAIVADVFELAAVAVSAMRIGAFRLCRLVHHVSRCGWLRSNCRRPTAVRFQWRLLSFNVGQTPWAGRHRSPLHLRWSSRRQMIFFICLHKEDTKE